MESAEGSREENPWVGAGPLSRLFFAWVTPLVWTGYKSEEDFRPNYAPRPGDKAERNHRILNREWEAELKRKKEKGEEPQLKTAILRGFGRTLVMCSISYFIRFSVLGILQTYFLDVLIGSFDAERNVWLGDRLTRRYVSAGLLLATLYAAPLLIHHAFLNAQIQGVRLAAACSSMVYQKTLRTSRAMLNTLDVGMLFNLLSNDVGKFDLAMNSAYTSFMEPLSIVINVLFLYWMIGWSALPGFAVMAVVICVYMAQARFFKTISKKRTLATDERLKYTSNVLTEMRAIKMFSWDRPYRKLISDLRAKEAVHLRSTCFLRASNFTITAIADKMALFFSILCGVLLGLPINSHFIYPAWMTFSRVKDTFIGQITQAFEELVGCFIAFKRIQRILMLDEMSSGPSRKFDVDDGSSLVLNNLTTSWSFSNDGFQLKSLGVRVPAQTLCFVAGPVGSGKSSLLLSVLGEMRSVEGGVTMVPGRVGVASQEAWLFPATLRQNILFGLPMDGARYESVLHACALTVDLEAMDAGDMTWVGERGVGLSGGQKARINLARALYRQPEVLLLDDPLSAVDVNVGKHIMEHCLRGLASNKLRLLVCHQLHHIRDEDYCLYLCEGRAEVQGVYGEVRNDLDKVLARAGNHFDLDAQDTPLSAPPSSLLPLILAPPTAKAEKTKKKEVAENEPEVAAKRKSPHALYLQIFLKLGTLFVVLVLLVIGQLMVTSSDIWLQKWSAASGHAMSTDPNSDMYLGPSANASLNVSRNASGNRSWREEEVRIEVFGQLVDSSTVALLILSSLALLQFIFIYFGYLVYFLSCLKASQYLFDRMLTGVLSTDMAFFAANPKGRLINRFANDMEAVDDLLPINLGNAIVRLLNILGTMAVIIYCNYIIAIPLMVILLLNVFICKVFFKNMKPMKRLEASARSPVYTHFSSTLQGVVTVRAHQCQELVAKEYNDHQDLHTSTSVVGVFFIRWFGLSQDYLIACLTSFTTLLLLFVPGVGVGSKIGLSVSSIFTATYKLQFGIRQLCEADNKVISVERLDEYGCLQAEDGYFRPMPEGVSKAWPEVGDIRFEEVRLRYHPQGEEVLKGVSFEVRGGEKVGVVGRTGAGKSSLLAALFRLSPYQGRVLVDRKDVAALNLPDYRSRLSVIPQDPVLMASSIRYNLDPVGEHSDEELWGALEEVQLTEQMRSAPEGLSTMVIEGGSNMSAGQRQLMCLARAVLQRNRVITLDEATSNVDQRCDEVMQKVIRSRFSQATVLVIAHRLDTIIDMDKVMVLSEGRVLELDDPHVLLQDESSAFYRMVHQTGEESAQALKDLAFAGYKVRQFKAQE